MFNPLLADTGRHVVYYTFTDLNGCQNYDSLFVTVILPDSVSAGPNDTICINNGLLTLSGNYPATGGRWSGTGITDPSNGIFDPAGLATGQGYTLTYTIGDADCEVSDTKIVFVNDTPNVQAGPDFAVCADDSSLLLMGHSPLLGGLGYWLGRAVDSLGNFDPRQANPNDTTHLTYVFIDLNGCQESDKRIVTRNELPMVEAGPDTSFCRTPNNQPLPTAMPSGGIWSGNGVTDSLLGLFNPVLADTGRHVVYYTFTDIHGCSNYDSLIVTIILPDSVSAGPDDSICVNGGLLLLSGFYPLNTGIWSGTGYIGNNQFDPQASGVSPNNTYTLTYTIGTGSCQVSDDKIITVLDTPVVNAGLDFSVCESEDIMTLTSGSPVGGFWTGNGIVGTNQFDPGIPIYGFHTLTYSYTDPITGCTNTDFLRVRVDSLPHVSFTFPNNICKGDTVHFQNTSSGAIGYSWDFGDGNQSVLANPTHIYTDTGTYTIRLIATAPTGCVDSFFNTITIIQEPIVAFDMSDTAGCAVLTVLFTDRSISYGGSYFWNFGNGQTSTLANPAPVSYQQGRSDTVYYVSLTISNACGVITLRDSITVFPWPQLDVGTNVPNGCSPLVVQFGNASAGNATAFNWYVQGNLFSSDSIPPPITLTTGMRDSIYHIQVVGYNFCGTDTQDLTVTVYPNTLRAFFAVDTTRGCEPLTVNFTDFSSAPHIVYHFGGWRQRCGSKPHPYLPASWALFGKTICVQWL